MLFRLFRRHNYESLLIAIFLGLIFISPIFSHNFQLISVSNSTKIFQDLTGLLLPFKSRIANAFTFLVLTFLIGFFYHFILIKFSFSKVDTFYFLLFFFMYFGLFLKVDVYFIALIVILLIFRLLNVAITKEKTIFLAFNSGLLVGIITIFNPAFSIFLVFVIIGFVVIKSSFTKDVFAIILGFLSFYLLVVEIFFLTSKSLDFFKDLLIVNYPASNYFSIIEFLWLLLFFVAFMIFQGKVGSLEIHDRLKYRLNLFYILTVIALVFILKDLTALFLLIISVGIFSEYWFVSGKKSKIKSLVFYLMILASLLTVFDRFFGVLKLF